MSFIWTDDAVAELRRCAEASMSAGAAALHITDRFDFVSRNGVLGKAFRLGVSFTSKPPSFGVEKGDKQPKRRSPRKPNWSPVGHKTPQPPTHVFTGDPAEIPERQRKTLLQLENQHCRWPYGDVGTPGFFFCGAPEADCVGGKPYCPMHTAAATGKAYAVSDRDRERRHFHILKVQPRPKLVAALSRIKVED